MMDPWGRRIDYLRISVTDRCNLRCSYCAPCKGFRMLEHDDILRYEEILAVVRACLAQGFRKFRITGGEPLVRKGVVDLVGMIAPLAGVEDLALTTNGQLLARHAEALAAAGLQRVNISLDTIDPAAYRRITGGGELAPVLAGIAAARAAGLTPIKLNCVVERNRHEPRAQAMAAFAAAEGLAIRYIPQMDMNAGHFGRVDGGSGGDCPRCNRLRLSSDGRLRPCLFADLGFGVRELGAEGALRAALAAKPERGGPCEHDWMHGIGG